MVDLERGDLAEGDDGALDDLLGRGIGLGPDDAEGRADAQGALDDLCGQSGL